MHVDVDGREAVTLRAGVVVNATGVWAQRLAPSVRLVPSRGSHLVLRAERLGSPSAALTVPLPGSRSRYVFALPQADGLVYLGITDERVDGPVPDADPQPSDGEVRQLLDTVNQVLAEPLTTDDVVGAYAGLRPLVLPAAAGAGPGARPPICRASTCCRGRDRCSASSAGSSPPTGRWRRRRWTPSSRGWARGGADDDRPPAADRGRTAAGARVAGGARPAGRALRDRGAVVAGLGSETVVEGRPETIGELRFAVRHEGARTVEDLLDRRTRIGLVPADRARAVATADAVLGESLS